MSTSFAEAVTVHSQDLQQLATDIVAKAMRAVDRAGVTKLSVLTANE